MAPCSEAHKEFDSLANGDIQSGTPPSWLHVQGKVAWYVYQAPYSGIGRAFPRFLGKVASKLPGQIRGAPGDVYVCSPEDHTGSAEHRLTTIFWVPIA